MKKDIYKLKRYKAIYIIINILFLPIRFPLVLLLKLEECLGSAVDFIDCVIYKLITYSIKIFIKEN